MTQTKEIHHVYVIHDGRYSKVGITKDLSTRLYTHRTHNPDSYYYFHAPFKEREDATKRVSLIKESLASKRVRGTYGWYDAAPDDIKRRLLEAPTRNGVPQEIPTSKPTTTSCPSIIPSHDSRVIHRVRKALIPQIKARYRGITSLPTFTSEVEYSPPGVNMRGVDLDDHLVRGFVKDNTFYLLSKGVVNLGICFDNFCHSFTAFHPSGSKRLLHLDRLENMAEKLGWQIFLEDKEYETQEGGYKAIHWKMTTPYKETAALYERSLKKFCTKRVGRYHRVSKATDFVVNTSAFPLHTPSLTGLLDNYVKRYHTSDPQLLRSFERLWRDWQKSPLNATKPEHQTVNQS